ncbi:TlpA family protein disulfide reductase [Saccharicrinis sp. FJH62]|uniref:TlpA family protein disulfide reductase n=1 Tax=Saccharicrinis sp. FJH62 TaxID=3344657 RepID=UPI0035D4B131
MKFQTIILFILFSLNAYSQDNKGEFIMINDTLNQYGDIDKILNLGVFKNKVVYVDIWGTKCGPCLNEFQYLDDLKQRFRNDSVVYLYMCSRYGKTRDKANEKLWEELVFKNRLKGVNILISNECYKDGFWQLYKNNYSENRLYGIPTYLLVNKDGDIINFDAPRPSKKEILYSEIQKLLDE